MTVGVIDHITLVTGNLDRTIAFYGKALGFKPGPRPPFNFPGAWLYSGKRAVVHLIGGGRTSGGPGSGVIDHVAFRAKDHAAMIEHLEASGIPHTKRIVPDQGLRQVFIHDPDGIRIELNFPADEPARRSALTRPARKAPPVARGARKKAPARRRTA